jgi:tRNA (guanine-N7-)-methyltransferase
MSRRALRKIDAGLDLSRSLLMLEQLPRPWDDMTLFGRKAPLEVEVGSGKGLFLTQAASARPEHSFLGVEISAKYARFCAARVVKYGLANARLVHGDAQRLLAECLLDGSVAAVHVYFPDPWWKKRHKKRRVMKQGFLRNVERVLEVGGGLHFWTDVEEYFQTTLELIAATTQLAGPRDVQERVPESDLDYRTHFERRMRLGGQAVYRAEFQKAGSPTRSVAAGSSHADRRN